MNSSLYPTNLWSGDIYVVSTHVYESTTLEGSRDPLLASPPLVYRFDDIPGPQALRPFQNSSLHDALATTESIIKNSAFVTSELTLKILSELKHVFTHEQSHHIGGFEDVILALSPDSLVQTLSTDVNRSHLLRELQHSLEAYDNDLYTVVYPHQKTYAKWGVSDMDTIIHEDIEPTKAMICVVPFNVGKKCTGFWQALYAHYHSMNVLSKGNTRLHIDPEVEKCGDFNNIEKLTIPLKVKGVSALKIAG